MSVRTGYTQGTPCWPQLISGKPEDAVVFYEKVLGWTLELEGDGFFTARLDGKIVAGIMPPGESARDGWKRDEWLTFIAVDDAQESAQKFEGAGGKLHMQPMTVGDDDGVIFGGLDPAGANVWFWQARDQFGAELVNQPGTVIWNEYNANSLPEDLRFYQDVLGVQWKKDGEGADAYYSILVDGKMVAGAQDKKTPQPSWVSYFAVSSLDDALASVDLVGGKVVVPTMDVPDLGQMAGIEDSGGAFLMLMQPSPDMKEQPDEPITPDES